MDAVVLGSSSVGPGCQGNAARAALTWAGLDPAVDLRQQAVVLAHVQQAAQVPPARLALLLCVLPLRRILGRRAAQHLHPQPRALVTCNPNASAVGGAACRPCGLLVQGSATCAAGPAAQAPAPAARSRANLLVHGQRLWPAPSALSGQDLVLQVRPLPAQRQQAAQAIGLLQPAVHVLHAGLFSSGAQGPHCLPGPAEQLPGLGHQHQAPVQHTSCEGSV